MNSILLSGKSAGLKVPRSVAVQLKLSRCLSAAISKPKKKLVILGTGWASYALLKKIDQSKYSVSVVSPRNYFLFTPLLASTTVGTLEFRSIIEPIRNFKFKDGANAYHFAYAVELNRDKKTISCRSAMDSNVTYDLPYDYLVIGVGCLTNTFNVPGVKEHAFYLKELPDARNIRKRIISNFEVALEPSISEEEQARLLHTVIVGGGPTGVEFGAELYDFLKQDVSRYYQSEQSIVRVSLIESNKILSSFDDRLQKFAEKKIAKRKPYFSLVKDQVVEVTDKKVRLSSGNEIPCGLVVWSTGLAARDFTLSLDWAEKNPAGQLLTEKNFALKSSDNSIFAIGDCADIKEYSLPSTAQVAERQGFHLAANFNSGEISKDFIFKSMGMLAYIGEYQGLTDLPGAKMRGVPSWFLWRSAYLTRLGSLRLRMQVPLDWTKTILFGRDTSSF